MNTELYVIWSEEHGAWWLPHKMGYTRSLREAGCYTKAEADEIVANANQYVRPHDVFNEVALPDPLDQELYRTFKIGPA
jgi:hypothetical protein